jgi:hypothetical protein
LKFEGREEMLEADGDGVGDELEVLDADVALVQLVCG